MRYDCIVLSIAFGSAFFGLHLWALCMIPGEMNCWHGSNIVLKWNPSLRRRNCDDGKETFPSSLWFGGKAIVSKNNNITNASENNVLSNMLFNNYYPN
jgi:hypothetical protein